MSKAFNLKLNPCRAIPTGQPPPNVCVVPGDREGQKTLVRPPGYRYANAHGMQFAVRSYASFGFMGAPAHHSGGHGELVYHGDRPPTSVLPLISHLNPTPRLQALTREVDAVTPKQLLLADSAGLSQKSRTIMEGFHFTSWRELPDTAAIVIDSNVCDEGILAHELMHIWLDLVEGYEDHRSYHEPADGRRYFAVISAQSFIIDCKVQEKLKERGFPLRRFTEDVVDALYETAVALEAGIQPENRTQESLMARMLTRPFAVPELYDFTAEDWAKIRYARDVSQHRLPDAVALADQITGALKRHDYRTPAGMRRLIDELLLLQFRYIREDFEIQRDLVPTHDHILVRDKFPHLLSNVPPREKHEILRKLIREKWPTGTRVAARWLNEKRLHVEFILPPSLNHGASLSTDHHLPFQYDGDHQGGR